MARNRPVTIGQVARDVGVSTQTVSRVLNNRPDVAPETRQRVQARIKQLGYQPSAIARGLVSKRTHTLGLITADFSDYFFTQVIAGAEAEARRHGYFFMLGSTELNPEDEPEYVRLFAERHVEGMLFARPSTDTDPRYMLELLRDGLPMVSTADYLRGESLTVVDIDNIDGAFQATMYLLQVGHRAFATITGPATWKSVHDRTRGYSQALQSVGLVPDPRLVIAGDWSYESGFRAMQTLLATGQAFSAVFIQNDQMAIGAIRALREAGRRVPVDVSIVGYDDIPGSAYGDPPLTTVHQPMREVGEVATRMLIQSIEHPSELVQQEILLKTTLIQRASCAAP